MSPTSRRLLVAFLLVGAAVCVRLAFWQLERLQERRAANRTAAEARAAPLVTLPGPRDAGELAQRRVVARGRYDPGHEIVIRGQAYNGVPGVHLVTPLRLEGTDTAILVNRGFVPAPDAVTPRVGDLDEAGERQVEGIALEVPTGGGQPIERQGKISWARLDRGALAERVPYPVLPVYLLQAPGTDTPSRLPRRVQPPPLDDGPHLNYVVQWLLFAAMAVAFALIVVARGDRLPRAPS